MWSFVFTRPYWHWQLNAFNRIAIARTLHAHTWYRTYEYLYQFYWAKNELALDKQRVHLTPGLSAFWLAAPKSHCHGLLFVYMHGYSCNKRRRRSGISSYLLFLLFFLLHFVNAIQIYFSFLYACSMRCDDFWKTMSVRIRSTSFKWIMELITSGFLPLAYKFLSLDQTVLESVAVFWFDNEIINMNSVLNIRWNVGSRCFTEFEINAHFAHRTNRNRECWISYKSKFFTPTHLIRTQFECKISVFGDFFLFFR